MVLYCNRTNVINILFNKIILIFASHLIVNFKVYFLTIFFKLKNNIYCLKKFIKKSEGFLKMDIFKNVQNRKAKESFEKSNFVSKCDENALKII